MLKIDNARYIILTFVFISVLGIFLSWNFNWFVTAEPYMPAAVPLASGVKDSIPKVNIATATETRSLPPPSELIPAPNLRELEQEVSTWKNALTSYFWVGEDASGDNTFISNTQSYFDGNWEENYGGDDNPYDRCGYLPCTFTPKENPFYFALPYGDLNTKNRWIEIEYQNATCYAQWEDVGPFRTDDFEYVFGNNAYPKNQLHGGAGLDISPAVRLCLGMEENDMTRWRFVEEWDVPNGPWKEIITH